MSGKTLDEVGRSVGMSAVVSDGIERATSTGARRCSSWARIGAVVGLDVRLHAFSGVRPPLRDAVSSRYWIDSGVASHRG